MDDLYTTKGGSPMMMGCIGIIIFLVLIIIGWWIWWYMQKKKDTKKEGIQSFYDQNVLSSMTDSSLGRAPRSFTQGADPVYQEHMTGIYENSTPLGTTNLDLTKNLYRGN